VVRALTRGPRTVSEVLTEALTRMEAEDRAEAYLRDPVTWLRAERARRSLFWRLFGPPLKRPPAMTSGAARGGAPGQHSTGTGFTEVGEERRRGHVARPPPPQCSRLVELALTRGGKSCGFPSGGALNPSCHARLYPVLGPA
jgi:hypothetical protein